MNKHVIHLKQWQQSGITRIKNLLSEDHSFLSYDVFQQYIVLKVTFTAYYGLINAYLPTLLVFPGVSKFFMKSPNLPGTTYHGSFTFLIR